MENDDVVAVAVLESVNRIVMALVPATVGVPEITPEVVFSVTPVGKVPEATAKVPEPEPPEVAMESE